LEQEYKLRTNLPFKLIFLKYMNQLIWYRYEQSSIKEHMLQFSNVLLCFRKQIGLKV